ncbi:hypothetical protein OEA41_006457 [Lepraria neglecta]|uniref:Uncharacterized protein n=1 Tax=Lepraria neglecta TaxID=209136 RepID=A0AAE0DN26_9LECA|nr:hypothetical protein OEA41_006457 [Lepraria neglecta]
MVAEQIRRELTGQTYLIARMVKEASTIEHRLVDLHTYLYDGFGVDFFPRHTTTANIKQQAREELAKKTEEHVVTTMTAKIEQLCLERERNSLRQQTRQEIIEEQAAEAAREAQEEAHQAARIREWEAVFKSQARRVFQFPEVKNTFRTIGNPANSIPNSLQKIPS